MSSRDLKIRLLMEAMDKVTGPLKAMAGGSTRAAQALKSARQELDRLKQAQNNISAFRALKQELKGTETGLEAAQTKVAALARQMQATDAPTKKLATEFARAKREAAALKDQHGQQAQRLQQLRANLSSAGISTGNLADHERRLRTETARTNDEIAEQSRRLEAMQDRSQRLAAGRAAFGKVQGMASGMAVGGATSLGAGMALGVPIAGAVDQAMQFQSVMTDIGQKADMSREATEKMGDNILKIATRTNQLPEALQQGVDVLAGFGLDPRQAEKMIEPIGRAATAYKAEMSDLSTAGYAAVDNLKVPINETGRVLDVMAQAGKSGAFEIKDMAQYFPALTAASQALGQTGVGAVGDLAAALQITRKGAGDSATAANNLQNLLNKINAKDTVQNFAKFGVDLPNALKKAAKDGKSPIEAITELTRQALGGDMGKLSHLFGDAQVQAALRPLMQNIDLYRQIRADALNANGVVDKDFVERMKDASEKAKSYRVAMDKLGITMGKILLPAANAIREKITALANRFSEWANQNPKLAKGIAWIAGGIAAAMIVFGGLALAISGLLAPFAALAFIAGVFGIGMLPLIGIVGAVVAGIALLSAGAYLLYSNWDGISKWFEGMWNSITASFNSGIAWFSSKYAAFKTAGSELINGLISGITGRLTALKDTIVNAAGSAVAWFKQKLGIHSPSRVFMDLGGFVMSGLNHGIAGGEAGPIDRLKSLSGRMAAAMAVGAAAPALAAASPAAAGATSAASAAVPIVNHYTITINASGAGGQDIAQQVREAIERIEREKAARSFRDS